jgi:outer membrane protein TolC
MSARWIRWSSFAVLIVAPLARADEPLRLADAVAEARARSPAIAAARERVTAAQFVPSQASAYDDPTFSWEAWNTPESFAVDRADNNIFRLTQKIPFPGKRGLAGRRAERDADMARAESAAKENEIVATAKRAYFDLWQREQNVLIYRRDADLVARFARIAEQKYAVGQVSQPDVLRAQVERTRLLARVETERLGADEARAELRAVLGRSAGAPLGMPEDPPPPRLPESAAPLVERALAMRPELAASAASVAGAEAKVEAARLGYLPDFEFSVSRFVNHDSRNGFGAMAAVSLPFANLARYDAALGEERARVAAAEAERRLAVDGIRRDVTQAYLRARSAMVRREVLVTTHVAQADQALAASEIGYQTGKVDFLSLVDSLRAIEAVHLEHVEAEADFQKALADLERAVGEPIETGEEAR